MVYVYEPDRVERSAIHLTQEPELTILSQEDTNVRDLVLSINKHKGKPLIEYLCAHCFISITSFIVRGRYNISTKVAALYVIVIGWFSKRFGFDNKSDGLLIQKGQL